MVGGSRVQSWMLTTTWPGRQAVPGSIAEWNSSPRRPTKPRRTGSGTRTASIPAGKSFASILASCFSAAKHWPASSFAELARLLRDERGSQVLVLCGPKERELARAIVQQAGSPAIASLAEGDVSLGLTKACIRRSSLLVTTDSGPRHFATSFDRPVVTLFGPTHIAWTETFHPLGVNLQKQVACGPCQQRLCPLDHRCMTLLTPCEVLEASVKLLERAGDRRASSITVRRFAWADREAS